MDVNALHKDELEFELECRGVFDCQNVATMRKFLRTMLKQEASGESSIAFKVPKACIESPASEIQFCRNRLVTLIALIADVSQSPDSALVKRLSSRLTHLANRAKLIIPTEQADTEGHLALLKDIGEARLSLESIDQEAGEDEEDSISEQDKDALHRSLGEEAGKILSHLEIGKGLSKPPALSDPKVLLVDQGHKDKGQHWNICEFMSQVPSHSHGLQRSSTINKDPMAHKRKLVPIKDWGVKFSGKGTMSINAFLERVDELREARNADEDDLFRYAVDFFEEEALIWFRAQKSTVSGWSELVKLLLDTFQKPDYQDELLEEIKRRTQSGQESVVIYISIMQNMFNRLPEPLTDRQKLVILRKNLQPYFQKEICRDTFNTVAELTSILRIIERTKINCEKFKEPSQSNYSLERDLAYQGSSGVVKNGSTEVAAIENNPRTESRCWNCRYPGHRFRDCKMPKQRLFCFKCGRFGNTVQKCSCNNNKEGNDHSEPMSADRTPKQ